MRLMGWGVNRFKIYKKFGILSKKYCDSKSIPNSFSICEQKLTLFHSSKGPIKKIVITNKVDYFTSKRLRTHIDIENGKLVKQSPKI